MGKKDASKKRKEKNDKKERNFYDRILKENAKDIFIILIQQELGITINTYTPLPEKITKTVEREMDFLYLINEKSKDKFILHIEFQSKNDREMLYRMARYHGLAFAKHKIPIKHVVIHLGSDKPSMKKMLEPEEVFREFDLISIHGMDAEKLLQSQVPEVIIMALLGAYPEKDTEIILRYIVRKLKKICKSEKDLDRYLTQLLFFSRLRNLEDETIKIIEYMPIRYDISKDALYLRGKREERERLTIELTEEKERSAREKERLSTKLVKEKERLSTKLVKEKERLSTKLVKEKERLSTKLAKEKERLSTKLATEKEEQKLIYTKLLDILSIPEIVERFGVSAEYLEALKKE